MTRPPRSLPRLFSAFIAFFAAMGGATADTGPPPETEGKKDPPPPDDPKPTLPDAAPDKAVAKPPAKKPEGDGFHPLLLAVGVDSTLVRADKGGLTRVGTLIGVSIIPTDWLELSTDLHIGYAAFKYKGKAGDDVTLDGELSRDGHVTLTSGVRFKLLERKRVRWTLFAEYETSFGSNSLNVDSVKIGLGGSELDLTEYIRQHGRFDFAWHRFAVGTGIRIETGRVSPTFSVGFERLSASVDVRFDDEARRTLEAFGKDASSVEKRHSLDHNTPSFYPGIDIRLPYRMRLEVQGMIVPIPDGWAFGAGLRYSFRP